MVVLCFFNFSVILSFDFWLGYKILLGWKCPSKFFESWTFYPISFVTNGASFRRVVFLETFIVVLLNVIFGHSCEHISA